MKQTEKVFTCTVNLSKKNLFCGIFTLALSMSIFVFCPYLLVETLENGSRIFHLERCLLYALIMILTYAIHAVEFDISRRVRRRISWTLLLVMPLICTLLVEWINSTDLLLKPNILKWLGNYLCYLLIFLLVYGLFRRVRSAVIVGSLISVIFGIATYYTLEFRGLPVLPWDFQALSTALGVAGGYEFIVPPKMVFAVLILLFIFSFTSKIKQGAREDSKKYRRTERFVSLTASILLLTALLPLDLLGGMGINVWPWNQKASTQMTGVSAGFVGNLQFVMVEKPDNYSADKVEELYEEISSSQAEEHIEETPALPTIIAVMNESFVDFEAVARGNLELSQEAMPFFHSLMERSDVISGTAYSSVFGGNTCDSEFEFLTGNSVSFLPVGSKPFQQYINSEQTSLVSTLQHYNYKSIAIHPGNETAWNRDSTYPLLGFDQYIYNKSFATKRELTRGLTEDASCYNEVIYRYEKHKASSNDPLFLYNVTIENHGGYEHEDFRNTMYVKGEKGKYPRAEEYLTLIKKSDEDFRILYDYFSKVEEPVILLFFGDHWPTLDSDFSRLVLDTDDLNELSIEKRMQMYEVPYFIWANYEMEEVQGDFSRTSINYLSTLLLKAAGLEMTAYNSFIMELQETLPVVSGIGIMDNQGNFYSHGENEEYDRLLNDYAVLQYNQIFGDKEKLQEVFTLAAS